MSNLIENFCNEIVNQYNSLLEKNNILIKQNNEFFDKINLLEEEISVLRGKVSDFQSNDNLEKLRTCNRKMLEEVVQLKLQIEKLVLCADCARCPNEKCNNGKLIKND